MGWFFVICLPLCVAMTIYRVCSKVKEIAGVESQKEKWHCLLTDGFLIRFLIDIWVLVFCCYMIYIKFR